MIKVLVFGTGDYLNKILKRIEERYEIIGFLDNQIEKQNTYIRGKNIYPVMSPQNVKELSFDKVVIASNNYASEMFSQLLSLGVREHDIVVDFVSIIRKIYIYDFLKMQVNLHGEENRFDIAVKYSVIEEYYGKNKYGYALYKKMQMNRLQIDDIKAEGMLEKFKDLIKSFEQNGLQKDSYIVCDEKLRIMDGAHRTACCLYFNIPFIQIKIVNSKFECDYKTEWFWEQKFTIKDIEKISIQYQTFFKPGHESITAVLWPPAYKYFEEITKELSCLVEIEEIENKEFSGFSELQNMVRAIYSVDDIEEWKIQKKLEYMMGYVPQIHIVKFKLRKPSYRLKESTYLPLSVVIERIKKIVRTRFKERVIPYYYDIIIHIADNYYQSAIINKLLTLDLNMASCFDQIKKNRYALTKMDVPYMPVNFPHVFPVHKDADIICDMDDFEVVVKNIMNFCQEYAKKHDISIRVIHDHSMNCRIRLEYLDYLIYQFDISAEIQDFNGQFIKDAIINRKDSGKGYYQITSDYEVLVRLNEILRHPQKIHHMQYLKDKKLNRKWIEKYFLNDNVMLGKMIDETMDKISCDISKGEK